MSYIGNNLQVAYPSYRVIDDISSGFNGVLKTFALKVAGSTPIPFPINPQQCLLSVNNIVQKPDSTGASGFTLTGSNIVFATAPTAGWSFFGTVLAGADYVNAGANFPPGTAAVPSVTFDESTGTGLFLVSSNVLGIATSGVQQLTVDSSGNVSVTGVISSALGTAAAPAYRFTGDPNTGVYSPGADQVAISTNSAQRLLIDSAGNIGVGISPGYKFDVAGAFRFRAQGYLYDTAGTSQLIRFTEIGARDARMDAFNGTDFNGTLRYAGANLIFETGTGAGVTERLRIISTGNVGIGTSSPGDLLHISSAGADTAAIRLQASSGRSYLLGSTGSGYGSANNFIIYDATASAARLTVNSSGNVGIGTSSPNKLLHVAGTEGVVGAYQLELEGRFAGYGAGLQFSSRTTDGGTLLGMAKITADGEAPWDTTAANQDAGLRFYTTLNGTLAEKLRISASGQVGIGTTGPSNTIDVNGTGRFRLGGTNQLVFTADGGNPYILSEQNAPLHFGTNNLLRATIDSSGRLLVGTSSTSASTNFLVTNGDAGKGVINIASTSATPADGQDLGYISFNDSAHTYNNAIIRAQRDGGTWTATTSKPTRLVLSTTADGASSPTERLRIDSSGRLGLGTSAPSDQLEIANGTTDAANAVGIRSGRFLNAGQEGAQLKFYSDNTSSWLGTREMARIGTYGLSGDHRIGSLAFFLKTTNSAANPSEMMRLTSTGLGIGTTSPSQTLEVVGDARITNSAGATLILNRTSNPGALAFAHSGTETGQIQAVSGGGLNFYIGSTPSLKATIDSSGRLLVGISGARSTFYNTASAFIQLEGGATNGAESLSITRNVNDIFGGSLILAKTRGAGDTIVTSGDTIGNVTWQGNDGSKFVQAAAISAQVDGTPGANDMPGRLVFSTTADGAASPTERMRITQAGTTTLTSAASTAPFIANISASEVARIDTSGRFLVGTSTSGSVQTKTIELHNEGTSTAQPAYQVYSYPGATPTNAGYFDFYKSRGSTIGTRTIVASGDTLGYIRWAGANGTGYDIAAQIIGEVDGTPGASSDMPGRLLFCTTANGSSLPTERMRITSDGALGLGVTTPTLNYSDAIGVQLYGDATNGGIGFFNTNNKTCIFTNRKATDGDLISFAQDGTVEGTISVSGTTVSYNGAHLSRWSQLPSGTERTEILRGSVLANIDEMCKWNEEDNEQLNRMKVSDVEGDKNVSGVFQDWDDDDDTYINDFYCAMTGDFIIRIAEGVTVERGDLLMSAGDGTAKSQDDDIIRSNTVAKVTSTHVTCTYDDGSYCVPCVLMAC
jgi:hypothetical protein